MLTQHQGHYKPNTIPWRSSSSPPFAFDCYPILQTGVAADDLGPLVSLSNAQASIRISRSHADTSNELDLSTRARSSPLYPHNLPPALKVSLQPYPSR